MKKHKNLKKRKIFQTTYSQKLTKKTTNETHLLTYLQVVDN
jgi:hypothetical protein